MCVIAIAVKERLDESTIIKCNHTNSHGIGVAWNNGNNISFKKGILLKEAIDLAKELPLPYIMHFRLATAGGKGDLLCHPFVVSKESPLAKEGTADKLLFHNGHWHQWTNIFHKTKSELKEPISDSRFIASLISESETMLHLIDGKFVTITKDKIMLYGDWQEYKGNKFSNLYWSFAPTTYLFHTKDENPNIEEFAWFKRLKRKQKHFSREDFHLAS